MFINIFKYNLDYISNMYNYLYKKERFAILKIALIRSRTSLWNMEYYYIKMYMTSSKHILQSAFNYLPFIF